MNVKLQWLNELVDLNGITLEEIVSKVSLKSIEIETVSKMINASNIVVGHVLTKIQHPDADKLSVLTVDVGSEILQIVCGAPNVSAGQYVVIAKVGAVLPGDFKIKKSKIRGVESNGMVCSLEELGLEKKYISEKYADGIYYFDEPQELGMSGDVALGLADYVIELGITPNRGDLLSMIGVAYELAAVFNRPLKPLTYNLIRTKLQTKEKINVKIESDSCLSYYGQLIKDVVVGPSPAWLISRLIAFGVRPINNLVDITNYILALFGQPLHAFDYDTIGNNIIVRNAKKGEEILTLDDEIFELNSEDLVITDGVKPIALAGVMGGLHSGITNKSKNIVLEAAVFNPSTVRKTSSRLNLRSESSYRYERGVDVNRTKLALDYACFLYQELANGVVSEDIAFDGIKVIKDKEIKLDPKYVEKLLGIKISKQEIIDILTSLSFTVNDDLTVYIPNRRSDICIKEDLVEEIVRLYGYDKLPATFPIDNMTAELTVSQKKARDIRNRLSSLGLNEVVTYSLVSDELINKFPIIHNQERKQIELLMPISLERKQLRRGLVPSILEVFKYNTARKNNDIAIFELSNIYDSENGELKEQSILAGAMAGRFSNTPWKNNPENVDFYLVKGILQNIFNLLEIEVEYLPLAVESLQLHPNRTAIIKHNDIEVGYIGQLHPQYVLENDLEMVYVFEVNLSSIINIIPRTTVFTQIPKLPNIERDIAVVIKKEILAIDIIKAIKKTEKQALVDVTIFDVYMGKNVGEDEKSLAIKLTFANDGSLNDEVINNKIKKILKDLNYKFNAILRG